MRTYSSFDRVSDKLPDLVLPCAFAISITVSYEDIDAFSHVNNAVYLKWMNDCAASDSDSVGLSAEACVALDRGMAVRETRLVYQRPAQEGDEVIVANWVTHNDGRLRASRAFQIVRACNGESLLIGASNYACITLSTGRPTRMPGVFVDAYKVEHDVERCLANPSELQSHFIF